MEMISSKQAYNVEIPYVAVNLITTKTYIVQLFGHCIATWYVISRSLVNPTEIGTSWGVARQWPISRIIQYISDYKAIFLRIKVLNYLKLYNANTSQRFLKEWHYKVVIKETKSATLNIFQIFLFSF